MSSVLSSPCVARPLALDQSTNPENEFQKVKGSDLLSNALFFWWNSELGLYKELTNFNTCRDQAGCLNQWDKPGIRKKEEMITVAEGQTVSQLLTFASIQKYVLVWVDIFPREIQIVYKFYNPY